VDERARDGGALNPRSPRPGGSGPFRAFHSLRTSSGFRLLWISNVFFFGGLWTQTLILSWMAFEITHSTFLVALLTTFRFAPLLLGPFSGVLSDRIDRRGMLIGTNMIALVASAVCAVLALLGEAPYPVLLIAGLALGLAQSPSQPARAALVFQLVGRENLSNANALNVLAMNGSQMIGPALGGALIGLIGAPAALAVSVAWYAVALVALWRLRTPRVDPAHSGGSAWRMLIEGFVTIGRHRVAVSVLLITLCANVLIWPIYQSFMPVFADDVLHLDAAGLGAMLMCAGLGGVIGSLVIAGLGDFRGKGALFVGGTALWGVLWVLFALSDSIPVSLLLLCGIGLVSAPFGVLQTTLLLMATPPRVQGRALGVQELAIGMTPIAAAVLGAIAQNAGVAITTLFSGCLLIVCVLGIAAAAPQVLRYHGFDPVEPIDPIEPI